MFEQTKAFRIRFQLPEAQIGKTFHIRTIQFNDEGIHLFEGTLEDYNARKRYLKAFGVFPLEEPDIRTAKARPIPRGIGKVKVASVAGARDDLDDLSEFKVQANGAPNGPPTTGNRQPAPNPGTGASAAADLRHGVGANDVAGATPRPSTSPNNGLGSEDQVADLDGFSI